MCVDVKWDDVKPCGDGGSGGVYLSHSVVWVSLFSNLLLLSNGVDWRRLFHPLRFGYA